MPRVANADRIMPAGLLRTLGLGCNPEPPFWAGRGLACGRAFFPTASQGGHASSTCASTSAFALHRHQHGVRVFAETVRLAANERVPAQLGLTVRA